MAPSASTAPSGASADDDETCPVCKTTRYFNRDMEFLIHPACYHRMCRTCVERIFRDGPAQCPHAGCHRTLRLREFRAPFFADLAVERHVDVERRVRAVFNDTELDFGSADAYNRYLDRRQALVQDIVDGADGGAAERRLAEHEALHRTEIEQRRRRNREMDDVRRARDHVEAEARQARRAQRLREDARERTARMRLNEEVIDSLQGAEAGRAAEAVHRVILKKRGGGGGGAHKQQRLAAALAGGDLDSAGSGSGSGVGGLSIRGLRDRNAAAAAADSSAPYDPFGGLDLAPSRVDLDPALLAGYTSEWLDAVRTKHDFTAGGYSPNEYVARALVEAFSGLGVFVDEEKDGGAPAFDSAADKAVAASEGRA